MRRDSALNQSELRGGEVCATVVFALFFLKSCHHLLHPAMFAARREHFQTLFLRSPLQDVDVHVADAPAFHFQPARLVQVDGISPNKCPPVIVDNIFLVCRECETVCRADNATNQTQHSSLCRRKDDSRLRCGIRFLHYAYRQ